MNILPSLRGRIFAASALLAVLSIGAALSVVNVRVTRETERELQRQVMAAGTLVQSLRETRTDTFAVMARLIADLPKLKAAVATNDPPTVQDIASGYRDQLGSSLFLVTNASGSTLARVGARAAAASSAASEQAIRNALEGRETVSLWPSEGGVLQVVTVPISLGVASPQVLGALAVGFLLDDALAGQLKGVTGSDVVFGIEGRIVASTLPLEFRPALVTLLGATGLSHVRLGAQDYVALLQPLSPTAPSDAGVLVLRSRTEQLRFLEAIRAGLAVTAVVAVLLATLLSFAVARTITRPLAAITDVMRDVAATGDLGRKIALRTGHPWDDEDARLLAATFNALTESVGRFQREAALRERLSSLGRLSTVVAHEIRNPLMIIKASLHALKRPEATEAELREAVQDIDEEVARLNRVVNDVLDFARPIRFELGPTDVNALCRESATASEAAGTHVPVHLDLDPRVPPILGDAERLRAALVNMLVNAQHAVAERAAATRAPGTDGPGPASAQDGHPVALCTRAFDRRVVIVIADRGVGIDPANLARVFDPYFTTRRGGTGLGLAIARNVIEGLGGTINIESAPGRGTEIRLDFPAGDAAPKVDV